MGPTEHPVHPVNPVHPDPALLRRAQASNLAALEALWTQYTCRLPLVEARLAAQGVVLWWRR